jgi:hypothetical protein
MRDVRGEVSMMKVSTLPGGGTHKTLHLQLQVIRNIGLGRSGGQAVSAVEGKARPSFLKKKNADIYQAKITESDAQTSAVLMRLRMPPGHRAASRQDGERDGIRC